MQKITLNVKDDNKVGFLMELLKQFDFIDIQTNRQQKTDRYNFFASAGLWKNRDINAKQLRKQAWQRNR